MNNVYFTTGKGISLSEAGVIRGIASEICEKNKEIFKRVTFVNCDIDIVGSDSQPKVMSIGLTKDQLQNISILLKRNGELNALQSWLGEATTEKENYIEFLEECKFEDKEVWMDEETLKSYQEHVSLSPTFLFRTKTGWISDYMKKNSDKVLDTPKKPKEPEKLSEKDIIDRMNIKERAEYLFVEAMASTYGQSVHKGEFLEKARKEFASKLANPIECNENGKNTLLKYYNGSISEKELEDFYMEMQKNQRSFESRLTELKVSIKKSIEKQYFEDLDVYNKALADYKVEKATYDRWFESLGDLYEDALEQYNVDKDKWDSIEAEYVSKFNSWKQEKIIETSKLKIVIPEKYQKTFDEIKSLISDKK